MKIVVCVETLPDPDCVVMNNGDFDFEHCNVRLDSYSAKALEFAFSLKDRYDVPVHAVLLDSFKKKPVYDELQALGCDSVDWVKAPFTFDPFRRAELFAEMLHCDMDDIVIAGYHCETCCTNSIPMLIALNSSLPYFSEIGDLSIEDSTIRLTEHKTEKEIEVKRNTLVISVRTSRKLRYPSLRDRLTCVESEADEQGSATEAAGMGYSAHGFVSASEVTGVAVGAKLDTAGKAEELIQVMDSRGMFQI